MNLFAWNKGLETGVELLDEQHRNFFKKANAFFIQVRLKQNLSACTEELRFLENYLLYHFQAEEAFMIESSYPDFLRHQAIHGMMKMKAKAVFVQVQQDQYSDSSMQMFAEFIQEWIKGHIFHDDLDFCIFYKKYLEDQNAGRKAAAAILDSIPQK